jgi:hypothetical protein
VYKSQTEPFQSLELTAMKTESMWPLILHRIISNQPLTKVKDRFKPYSKKIGALFRIDADEKCG